MINTVPKAFAGRSDLRHAPGRHAYCQCATLTGAVVSPGSIRVALLSSDKDLGDAIALRAARRRKVLAVADGPEYLDAMKGDMSDLRNLGGSQAGTITAGKFLEQFVDALGASGHRRHMLGGQGATPAGRHRRRCGRLLRWQAGASAAGPGLRRDADDGFFEYRAPCRGLEMCGNSPGLPATEQLSGSAVVDAARQIKADDWQKVVVDVTYLKTVDVEFTQGELRDRLRRWADSIRPRSSSRRAPAVWALMIQNQHGIPSYPSRAQRGHSRHLPHISINMSGRRVNHRHHRMNQPPENFFFCPV